MLTRRAFSASAGALALSTAFMGLTGKAFAAETKWKAVANHRRGFSWADRWPWLSDELKQRSSGSFNLEVTTVPELGLNGTEIPRMLSTSLMDMADIVVGYVSGELPVLEAVQLPSIFDGPEAVRKVHERWVPEVVDKEQAAMGGKVYGMGDYSTSFLVSRVPVNTLDDIKGKKIRIYAASQADMLGALGAETLSIPSAEMYSALSRGVIDAVVTGPDQIFGQKLNEVSNYVVDLLLGDGPFYTVVSNAAWEALPPEHVKLLEDLQGEFNERGWNAVLKGNKQGLDYARENGMELTIPCKPEWVPQLKAIGKDVVAANWAKRAGPAGVAAFNSVIAPVVGFEVS